ncbi:pseudouridine synthase family protein [Helicobacter pametensis]|uniref:pseudouridine synthase family protein n=1 Tax=Helicobacter pametensis TaxID=95149 RepID=UPI00131539F6|nr:RluA family pseudouridine synthase [Helicobacter pametensis]
MDKNRLTQNNLPIHKSQSIVGEVSLTHFFPSPLHLPKILQTPYFVVYDKPHKLLTHPKGTYPHLSVCDALKYEFGSYANPAHRLDYETAGLLLCAIDHRFETPIKLLFEHNQIQKTYIARVLGHITQKQLIQAPILVPKKGEKTYNLSIRSKISPQGKDSQTLITPLCYDQKTHTTLLRIHPLTGRTHQIRLHLSYIGHPILGDPLYGCQDSDAQAYLEETLSDEERMRRFGAPFLHLWAYELSFEWMGRCLTLQSNQIQF